MRLNRTELPLRITIEDGDYAWAKLEEFIEESGIDHWTTALNTVMDIGVKHYLDRKKNGD